MFLSGIVLGKGTYYARLSLAGPFSSWPWSLVYSWCVLQPSKGTDGCREFFACLSSSSSVCFCGAFTLISSYFSWVSLTFIHSVRFVLQNGSRIRTFINARAIAYWRMALRFPVSPAWRWALIDRRQMIPSWKEDLEDSCRWIMGWQCFCSLGPPSPVSRTYFSRRCCSLLGRVGLALVVFGIWTT